MIKEHFGQEPRVFRNTELIYSDEIGAMVRPRDWAFRDTLLARGFRSLGEFHWLVARLPLPGLAAAPLASERPTDDHA